MTELLDSVETEHLTRRAVRLAQLTVAFNIVEGAVAIAAGLAAGLVSVIGFGIDSGIESAVAVLVAIRLAARLRNGEADEVAERRVLKIVAFTFFALATYLVVQGVRALVAGDTPQQSAVSIGLLIASLIVMPALAVLKTRVGRRLGDDLILADAAETKICVLLSLSTLIGVVAYAFTGATWLDPAAGFVIALFAIREGREAWHGELAEHEH